MITSTAERQELLDAAIEHVDALLALRRAKRHEEQLKREAYTWRTEQIDPLVDRVTRARCNFERLSGQQVIAMSGPGRSGADDAQSKGNGARASVQCGTPHSRVTA